MVHEQMSRLYQGFRRDAHPMAVMTGCVGALSAFYHDSTDISDPTQRMIASIRMIAKMPTMAAMAYKYQSASRSSIRRTSSITQPTSCACVLRCRARSTNPTPFSPARWTVSSSCMPITSKTPRLRLCGSPALPAPIPLPASRPVVPACGDRHMAVPTRRRSICCARSASGAHPGIYSPGQGQNDSFRLMGFGHRVYKNYDPRAKIMQKTCHEVLSEIGIRMIRCSTLPWSSSASRCTTTISLRSSIQHRFLSGITLKAMGFPTTMFTVLFAVARTVGWIFQWKEMIEDPHQKIGRPRQLYTGATQRDYVPISRRK